MAALVQKIVFGALSLALWIGYVSLCDGGSDLSVETLASIPPIVFEGGGGRLAIEVEVNQVGHLHTSFARWHDATDEGEMVEAQEALGVGAHRFEIDVADGTYGYLEVGIPDAEVGAHIDWSVALDGEEIAAETVDLEEPLPQGYAFFVQLEFDEIAQLGQIARH